MKKKFGSRGTADFYIIMIFEQINEKLEMDGLILIFLTAPLIQLSVHTLINHLYIYLQIQNHSNYWNENLVLLTYLL